MAVMNLSRLQDEAGNRVRNSAITDAQWTIWANQAQNEIVTKVDLAHLEYEATFSTVAARRLYYLDQFLPGAIMSVVDQTTDIVLSPIEEKVLENIDADKNDSGSPRNYTLPGTTQIEGQPSAASTLRVVSASASDTTQQVRIRGLVGGQLDTELLSLNGTSNVDGTLSFSEVISISKDANTSGRITVTDVTGGTTLAVIPRFKNASEYQKMGLWPVPNSVLTIMVRGLRRPMDFVNAQDVPDLPEAFHEIILIGMVQRGFMYLRNDKRADEMKAYFEEGIKNLKESQAAKFETIPRLRGRPTRFSISVGRLPVDFE